MQNGKLEEANAVLHRIHRDASDPEGLFAEREFRDIKEQCELENTTGAGTYKQLFTGRHNLKRLALGFATMFGQQCTGTIVINSKSIGNSTSYCKSNEIQTMVLLCTRILDSQDVKQSL